jgi:hypothetical protein
MANTLNASTSAGLVQTADTSGSIDLQSAGATKLTVSSSGTSIAQYNPSASLITSGTAVASTSGTSIDFTSIPSWVKRVTVMLSGVSTSGTSNYLIQIGAGSVTTTGYDSGAWSSNSANSASTAGFILNSSVSASGSVSGTITISLANTNRWVSSGVLGQSVSPTGIGAGSVSGGFITLGGTLDRVRITTVNGTDTFDAGSINILYE